jgi:hypothetical protein
MICTVVEEFKYDVNSYLIESTKTTEYHDRMLTLVEQCRYTNDEQGRPVSAELTEVKNGVSTYASQQWTYFYHTFYFYNDK